MSASMAPATTMKNSKIDTSGLPHHRILGQILYELICRESSGEGVRIASLRRELAADEVVARAYPHNLSKAISNSLRRLLWDGKIIREARGFYQVAPVSAHPNGAPGTGSNYASGSSSSAANRSKLKQKQRHDEDDDDEYGGSDDEPNSRKKARLSDHPSGSNIHLPPIHHLTDPRLSLAPPPPPPMPHHPYQYPAYHPHQHPGMEAQLTPHMPAHYGYYPPGPYAPPPPPPPPGQYFHHQYPPLGRSGFGTSWERDPPRFYTGGLPSHVPMAAPARQGYSRPGPFYAAHQVNQEISAFLPDIPGGGSSGGTPGAVGPGPSGSVGAGMGHGGSSSSSNGGNGSGGAHGHGNGKMPSGSMSSLIPPPPMRTSYNSPMRSPPMYTGYSAPAPPATSSTKPLYTSMPSSASRETASYQSVSSARDTAELLGSPLQGSGGGGSGSDTSKPLSIASLLSRPASPSETMRQHFAKRCPTLAKLVVEALQVLPSPQSHAVPAPAVRQWVYDRLSVSNSPVEPDRQGKVHRAADLMLASLCYTGVAQESGTDEMGELMFTLK